MQQVALVHLRVFEYYFLLKASQFLSLNVLLYVYKIILMAGTRGYKCPDNPVTDVG